MEKKGMLVRYVRQGEVRHDRGEEVTILENAPIIGYTYQVNVRFSDGSVGKVADRQVRAWSKSGLTPLQEQRIIEAMDQTWNAIADDWLQACGVGYDSGKTIPRSYVLEAVTDADRLLFQGNDREAGELFYKLPVVHQKRLMKEAFPYKRYGY